MPPRVGEARRFGEDPPEQIVGIGAGGDESERSPDRAHGAGLVARLVKNLGQREVRLGEVRSEGDGPRRGC